MRRTASEKLEIIRLVEGSHLSARDTLRQLDIPRSTFYGWYSRFLEDGIDGLEDKKPRRRRQWNELGAERRDQIVQLALERPALSPRELACTFTDEKRYFVSESTVYRILKAHDLIQSPAFVVLKAADEFKHPTRRVHELWQTDFTYLKVIDWGWYYLSTVMDDYSRYIIAWILSRNMGADDVQQTLDQALAVSGACDPKVRHRPRLLSDNGSAYVSGQLRDYLAERGMTHTRGAPYHPMTQGKIERYHQSMKNVVKLDNYYSPDDLRAGLADFITYYNNQRYHESLGNVTPADVYFGRHVSILDRRATIKRKTYDQRRRESRRASAA